MRFIFFSTPSYEYWDWRNPEEKGIGGSETSHIEMAARLARRGHDVHSYGPVEFQGTRRGPGGEIWEQCKTVDAGRTGVWIIYRSPLAVAEIPRDSGPVWLICQDVDYPEQWTPAALARVDRIVALCEEHAVFLRIRHPEQAHKVCVSSNGIRPELYQEIAQAPPPRNPRRLMYASSPDRGLWYLLMIFERAREVVRDLELHVFYGFDNIDKVIEKHPHSNLGANKERLLEMLKQPGVIHHGRVGQRELATEWFKTGLWVHPSSFPETSCITCMEAQAGGAVPVTNPIWACRDNVRWGTFVEGSAQDDALVRARYVLEVVKWSTQPELQEVYRASMMRDALEQFTWERWVTQWEAWAAEDLEQNPPVEAMTEEREEVLI